jgi:hypothetical protein
MKINLINLPFLQITILVLLHPSKLENKTTEKDSPGRNIVKIDLDKADETILLNPGEVARQLGVTPQYAWRVLRQKQPGTKIKEQLVKKHGAHKAA